MEVYILYIYMSINNTIYALSNINNLLGGMLGYVNDTRNGASTGYALSNAGLNIMNGAIRNEASRDIQQMTGSYLGYAVNNAAGYGNPVANYRGTLGTMGALMLSTPFSIFGCSPCMTSSLYGCGPYGYGYWNSGFFGGSCYNPFMFGGPSMFGCRGFLC